jgi:hypothetical protein
MDKFSTWLSERNPVDTIALCVVVLFWFWVWKRSADDADSYDIADNIKDPFTNKAAAAALVYLFLAGVSVWWVIRSAVAGGDPSNFLLAVLGVFIAKGAADRAIGAWGANKPPEAPAAPVAPQEPDTTSIVTTGDVSIQPFKPAKKAKGE